MGFIVRTKGPSGDFAGRTHEDFQVALLAEIRDLAQSQTGLLCRQVNLLQRIDERLKRNGMSLAKRNRK